MWRMIVKVVKMYRNYVSYKEAILGGHSSIAKPQTICKKGQGDVAPVGHCTHKGGQPVWGRGRSTRTREEHLADEGEGTNKGISAGIWGDFGAAISAFGGEVDLIDES
jgi:hypothetical protein